MAGRRPKTEAPPFGRRLAAIRKERGLSQEALATMLGTTRANVEYYERRATNPTVDFVTRAADVLDVTVAQLLDEEAPKPKGKPGPPSRLEQRIEQIRRLPKKDQDFVLRMLDTVLESADRT